MKVLFLTGMYSTPALPARGIIIERLGVALQRLGIDVVWGKLSAVRGGRRYLRAFSLTRELIRSARPDVIHVHFGYSGIGLPPTSIPVITSFYGDDLNGTWSRAGGITAKSRLGLFASQYVAWRSRRCVVVSAAMLERIWLPSVRQRTVVIRDAVDTSVFRPHARNAARQRLGMSEAPYLVIFPHDQTNPNKRVDLAQASIDALKTRMPNVALWIVNGVDPAAMPLYYAAADAMLVTSAIEGGPSSAKEALACGVPVVTVPVGDTQLAADAPESVTLVDASPTAIAGGLVHALTRSQSNRVSLIPDALTLDVASRRLVSLYDSVVVASRQPSRGRP